MAKCGLVYIIHNNMHPENLYKASYGPFPRPRKFLEQIVTLFIRAGLFHHPFVYPVHIACIEKPGRYRLYIFLCVTGEYTKKAF